jgi:hypothetical protein
MNNAVTPHASSPRRQGWVRAAVGVSAVALLLAPAEGARAGTETIAAGNGDRVTKTRTSGRSTFTLLFDDATQTNGFLNIARDAITGSASMDCAWATPSPSNAIASCPVPIASTRPLPALPGDRARYRCR